MEAIFPELPYLSVFFFTSDIGKLEFVCRNDKKLGLKTIIQKNPGKNIRQISLLTD